MIGSQLELQEKCVCFVLDQSSAPGIGGWNVIVGGLEVVGWLEREVQTCCGESP